MQNFRTLRLISSPETASSVAAIGTFRTLRILRLSARYAYFVFTSLKPFSRYAENYRKMRKMRKLFYILNSYSDVSEEIKGKVKKLPLCLVQLCFVINRLVCIHYEQSTVIPLDNEL
jgi:hypothetical protein